jgi:hypothetical protein
MKAIAMFYTCDQDEPSKPFIIEYKNDKDLIKQWTECFTDELMEEEDKTTPKVFKGRKCWKDFSDVVVTDENENDFLLITFDKKLKG